jgi:hypothetical protein
LVATSIVLVDGPKRRTFGRASVGGVLARSYRLPRGRAGGVIGAGARVVRALGQHSGKLCRAPLRG